MAIEQITDPRTRKPVTFITGKVEGVYFNELKNVKTYTSGKAPWTPTHSVNLVVDGTRVGLGLTDKDAINSKDVDGKYHALTRGMEVSVEVSDISQYKGQDQYNSKASLITVLDVSEAESGNNSNQSGGGNKQTYKKRDNKGVVAGNARTAATNWASRFGGGIEDHLELFAKLADDKRKSYAASDVSLDDFEVGVTVGQAVIAASQLADNPKELGKFVDNYLNVVVPKSLEIIEATQSGETAATKKAATKAAPNQPQKIEEPSLEDMDDDIPF